MTLRKIIAAAAMLAASAAQADQGVTNDKIVIGTIQDLSGPVAAFGKEVRNGMQMRVDEINAKGGIQGRKIELIVEDGGYDPKKAVMAAQKLVNLDKVFAVVGHIGSAHNMAAMPIQFSKNVPNWMPVAAGRALYEPYHKLKYAYFSAYYDQTRVLTPVLVKEKKVNKVCTVYQDDEFGLEVVRGADAGLKEANLPPMVERTTFKRGATEFSSQVAKLKSAGCDMVVLGTLLRETVGVMSEARKTGFNPVFLGTSGSYTALMPKLGGQAVDGLYAGMTAAVPTANDGTPAARDWVNRYKARFNEDPDIFSVSGYIIIESFARAAEKAGKNLTVDNFTKAADSLTIPPDMFGAPEVKFTSTQHLGSSEMRLSQIQGNKWQVISPYYK